MSLLSRFDAFHEQAAQLSGLSDFGPTDYVEPMKLLLSDLDKYCPHTEPGLHFTQGALVGGLVSRLLAAKGFKDNPEFANSEIEKPLIITGMPRTGSTSLQKLLAKDPNSQWLPPWLGGAPMPRPPQDTWESNPFFQATKQGLEHIYQAIPEVLAMHPMKAGEADECRYAIGSAFWSPDIAFTGPMSGDYAHWLTSEKPLYAYRYYRKLLGLIAGGDKRQWILKDPTTHPFAPETMLEVFPDARIVYTHRDPASAMSSVSNMLYYVRGLRVSGLKAEDNGRDQLAFWSPAIERLEACLSQLDSSRIVHVHISELKKDPVGTAERIYTHFGIPIPDETRNAWQDHVDDDPLSGHGTHNHTAELSGFSPEDVYARMPTYYENYRARYGC